MSAALTLGCARCGRRTPGAAGRLLVVCTRCAEGPPSHFTVHQRGDLLTLSFDEVRARLVAGTLDPTSWAVDAHGTSAPVCAHPELRALFLPGHPLVLELPEPDAVEPDVVVAPRRAPRPWVTIGGGLTAVAALLVATFAVVGMPGAVPAHDAAVEADPLAARIATVGTADSPRTLELALAWRERGTQTPQGRKRALDHALCAAARWPHDAEALALLAALWTEADDEPDLRRRALERARAASPTLPTVRFARGVAALRSGRVAEARRFAENCLEDAPDFLPCEELRIDALGVDAAGVTAVVAAYDALAARWPSNAAPVARAAVLAATADLPTARARIDEARRRMPNHPGLLAADVALRFRDGEVQVARSLASALGPAPSTAIALAAAEADIAANDAASALQWLRSVENTDAAGDVERRRIRRLVAQARWLLARLNGEPSALDAAVRAASRLRESGASGPADAQVLMLVACATDDPIGFERAWAQMSTVDAAGRDIARAWSIRAAQLARAPGVCPTGRDAKPRFRDAANAAEDAVAAEPSEPVGHLWRVALYAELRDPERLQGAIADALRHVDGRADRRNPSGGALVVGPDAAWVADILRVGADGGAASLTPLAGATMAWLAGDLDRASAGLAGLAASRDTRALRARVAFAKGDTQVALSYADTLVREEPREPAWHLLRAQGLARVRRHAEAAAELDRAAALRPTSSLVASLRAEVVAARGNRADAQAFAADALARDPLDLVARRAVRTSGVESADH